MHEQHEHRDIGWRRLFGLWYWVKRCACGHEILCPERYGPLNSR